MSNKHSTSANIYSVADIKPVKLEELPDTEGQTLWESLLFAFWTIIFNRREARARMVVRRHLKDTLERQRKREKQRAKARKALSKEYDRIINEAVEELFDEIVDDIASNHVKHMYHIRHTRLFNEIVDDIASNHVKHMYHIRHTSGARAKIARNLKTKIENHLGCIVIIDVADRWIQVVI